MHLRKALVSRDSMPSKKELIEKLLETPSSKKEHLGDALPDSSYAVSVCMPMMEHVHAYENGDEAVTSKFKLGYPRFFLHPSLTEYFKSLLEGKDSSLACFCYPSENSAKRAFKYVESQTKKCFPCDIQKTKEGLYACFFKKELEPYFKEYWQHSGEIVSGRFLEEKENTLEGEQSKNILKDRISKYFSKAKSSDTYLFPSGMAAFFLAARAVTNDFENSRVVQIGFPYVDSIKILEKFTEELILFPLLGAKKEFRKEGDSDEKDYKELKELASLNKIDAIFVEFPTNASLSVPCLKRISEIAKTHRVPLVLDETIASFYNFDLSDYADIVVSSLTKFFSGKGDVMAGSLVDCSGGKFKISELFEDLTDSNDMIVLEENSRDYEANFIKMQSSAQALAEYLVNHPKVKSVNYPGLEQNKKQKENYQKLLRKDLKSSNNFGALLSFELNEPEKTGEFYDKLNISKGPSFGTEFSLLCPYTLLAHYHELKWVSECGVSENLLRISAGLEDVEVLIERFEEGFLRVE